MFDIVFPTKSYIILIKILKKGKENDSITLLHPLMTIENLCIIKYKYCTLQIFNCLVRPSWLRG